MFGLGMPEILLILAIALIVIGPKKLPDLAKTLGRAMGEFKKAAQDFKKTIDLESTATSIDPPPTMKADLKGAVEDARKEAQAKTATSGGSSTADSDKGPVSSSTDDDQGTAARKTSESSAEDPAASTDSSPFAGKDSFK